MNMVYSKNGYDLTKHFESCRLIPYLDGGGVWTNGWGNTHHVTPGVSITQEQADADLEANVQDAVGAVNDHVTVTISQGEFDAIVDWTFNCGIAAMKGSTLLKKLNAGDHTGACAELDRWCFDNKIKITGLVNRRNAEQELFNE